MLSPCSTDECVQVISLARAREDLITAFACREAAVCQEQVLSDHPEIREQFAKMQQAAQMQAAAASV